MQKLWNTVWMFVYKLKIELPYYLTIPFLGIYPEKTKILNLKRYTHLSISNSTAYNSQDMKKTTQVPKPDWA